MRPKADRSYLIAVAYLSAEQKTQDQIAAILGISQSLVSRLTREAKETGILEVRTRFVSARVTPEERARLEAKLQTETLQQISSRMSSVAPGKPVPTFHKYPSHGRNTSPVAWRHRIQEFSNDCAEDLQKVLGAASVIGIAWGEMVANAVGAMQRVQENRRERRRSDQTIIPLLGEPLGRNLTQYSSSFLASKLAETLNPKRAETPDPKSELKSTLSLAPVPAFIPEGMTRAEINAIRNFIGKITAYRYIYGANEGKSRSEDIPLPWIDQVDTILTSISKDEQPLGFDEDRLIHAAGIGRDRLNDLLIGDLCGVVIPRPNLDSQSKKLIDNIMARWTGPRMDHIEACAARAHDGAPGVIVLAIGANKASVVYEALRRGLIQHLFMDEDLADRLAEICSVPPAPGS